MRITTGLLEFQVYLEYLQTKFEGSAKAMQIRIKALVLILKQTVSVSLCPLLVWGRQGSKRAAQTTRGCKANSRHGHVHRTASGKYFLIVKKKNGSPLKRH